MRRFLFFITIILTIVFTVSMIYGATYEELKEQLISGLSSGNDTAAQDAIQGLAMLDTAGATRLICQNMSKIAKKPELMDAAKQALKGLTSEEARKAVMSEASKGSLEARVILIEVLPGYGTMAIDSLCRMLTDKNDVIAKVAARGLGEIRDPEAVKPLIDAMGRHKKQKDGPYWDMNKALQDITGKKIDDHRDWVSWYGDGSGLKDINPDETPGVVVEGGDPLGTSVFGIPVNNRMIVLIDTSGSMVITDPLPEGYTPEPFEKDISTEVEDKDKKKKEKDAADAQAKADRKGLGAERQRIMRAKNELLRMIKAFDRDIKFNIIAFGSDVTPWKKKITQAKDEAKQSALAFVKKLEPDGLTFTDEAIKLAFEDKDVDTIILLSDGAPMHSPFAGGSTLPDECYQIIDEIHAWVAKENLTRKITIHTVAFPGANKEFMEKLAKDNNGTYKELQ